MSNNATHKSIKFIKFLICLEKFVCLLLVRQFARRFWDNMATWWWDTKHKRKYMKEKNNEIKLRGSREEKFSLASSTVDSKWIISQKAKKKRKKNFKGMQGRERKTSLPSDSFWSMHFWCVLGCLRDNQCTY